MGQEDIFDATIIIARAHGLTRCVFFNNNQINTCIRVYLSPKILSTIHHVLFSPTIVKLLCWITNFLTLVLLYNARQIYRESKIMWQSWTLIFSLHRTYIFLCKGYMMGRGQSYRPLSNLSDDFLQCSYTENWIIDTTNLRTE